ncbi:MAG TPA: GNAT family N-acetyltransferase, partial [Dehalococcoidia bacterium]|nr:GNAT family N-acetyltransferase [Dehalococcoidia bacterium]
MNIEFRPVREEEVDDFIRAESRGFGCNATDAYLAHGDRLIEADRTLAAFEGKRLVGTSTSHTLKMTVPGGAAVPTGG